MSRLRGFACIAAVVISGSLFSCQRHPLVNPLDPKAAESVGTVTLVWPAGAEVISDTTPTFTWEQNRSALSYHLIVSEDADLSSPGVDCVDIHDETYTLSGSADELLDHDVTYYWRVSAVGAGGVEGLLGDSQSFTVSIPAVVLEGPESPTTVELFAIHLEWEEHPLADMYAIEIDDSSVFDSPEYSRGDVSEESVDFSEEDFWVFTLKSWYYWRVAAVDEHGVRGAYSEQWRFYLDLEEVVLLMPLDDGASFSLTPVLAWESVGDATSYQVRWASTEEGLGTVDAQETGDTEYTIPEQLADGDEIFWQVRAADTTGPVTPWTPSRRFQVYDPEIVHMVTVIPFGESRAFTMGDESGGDLAYNKPVHEVTLTRPFAIARTEVTVGLFHPFVVDAPLPDRDYEGWDGNTHPANNVTWQEAVQFCNWLSLRDGLTPCYSGTGTDITWNGDVNGYRLPTEAEWEYAARGGELTHGYDFAGSDVEADVAWYASTSGNTTHPVGRRIPNELGTYDMTGNVKEYCWDW